jgi:Protein of unknown function/AsmA-like C-terminal region
VKLRIARITVLSVLTIVALLVAGAAGLFWRLSQGPVSISFLREGIVAGLNKQLGGIKVDLGGAILEVDQDTKIPSIRFLNVAVKNAEGEVLATAPKAAVSLDLARLMQAEIVPRSLDLIGPRILARRNIDGTFELGFDSAAPDSDEPIILEEELPNRNSGEKSDLGGAGSAPDSAAPTLTNLMKGRTFIELIAAKDDGNSLSALNDIRISRANLVVFDEANDARWTAPRTDFAFRKMPYGFILAAKSDIASGGDPWRLEFTASYKRDEQQFSVNAAIANLVPANLSDEIFALSDFAKVTVPLSGNLQMEVSAEGRVLAAKGEFQAAAGKVSFPEYFLRNFVVDEGNLRVSYDAAKRALNIEESTLLVGGTQIGLTGQLTPEQDETGRVRSIGIKLAAKNAKIDTQGTVKQAVHLDQISFRGKASVDEKNLEIETLDIRSGQSALSLQGSLAGGGKSIGMDFQGQVSRMSADLLQAVWPPPIAPNSRAWIAANIVEGEITDGNFRVKFEPNGLARALEEKVIRQGSFAADFNLAGVTSHYFKELPVLEKGVGKVTLRDDSIRLDINGGQATLPSGAKVTLRKGSFAVDKMLVAPAMGRFDFDLEGTVATLLEARGLPDLKLGNEKFEGLKNVDGLATVALQLSMPLMKSPPATQIKLTTAVALSNVEVDNAIPGINLTKGEMQVRLDREQTGIEGNALLNGIPSKIFWNRKKGEAPNIRINTVLDENTQARLGLKFGDYMKGPIPVDVVVTGSGAGQKIEVDADLSSVSMKLAAMAWSRDRTKGTSARFVLRNTEQGKLIDELVIEGNNLSLAGSLELSKANKLRVVNLNRISLDGGESKFAARIEPGDGDMDIAITGKSFDATPYIKTLISPAKTTGAATGTALPTGNFRINARFEKIYAFRGEVIENVVASFSTRGKNVNQANVTGNFLNGQPISIQLDPVEGGREIRVTSRDGGSTLRASNFYSKIAGGELVFYALMANSQGSPIRNGQLSLRNFDVRNEAALAELDSRGRPKKSGPRKGGISFKRLEMPFTTDAKFVRLGDTLLRGSEVGATAQGLIRKSDGAMDVTGTYIPAYGLNAALGKIPLFGDILTGGNKEGIFGVTYAVGGTVQKPKFQINPLSVVAPGVFRKLFEFQPPRRKGNRAAEPEGEALTEAPY